MHVPIHLIEWIILLAGLAAAMVPPTATGPARDEPREAPELFLARIAAKA